MISLCSGCVIGLLVLVEGEVTRSTGGRKLSCAVAVEIHVYPSTETRPLSPALIPLKDVAAQGGLGCDGRAIPRFLGCSRDSEVRAGFQKSKVNLFGGIAGRRAE